MKERPILFNAPMVRAILDGRKTQTRRVLSPQPKGGIQVHPFALHGVLNGEGNRLICRFGQPGDRLWVRETWRASSAHDYLLPGEIPAGCSVEYAADKEKIFTGKNRPSIFMPRWASRINLEITGVRAERLHDISDADAEAEGVDFLRHCPDADETLTAKELYFCLWEAINGDGSWDANPWVWVVEFKRIKS